MEKSKNNADLTTLRQQGDAAADALVAEIIATEGSAYIRKLFPFLSDYHRSDFRTLNPYFARFYDENARFPTNYNRKEMIRATDFYARHADEIGIVLGCYSLPYCYLGEDGARVLCFTQRIRNDTPKRLAETGQFLQKVMQYATWQTEAIFDTVFKVRILHAFVRHFTRESGKWQATWGVPVNQEDMAGTNLAFSLIVLRGLRKIGVEVDESVERAYLRTWAYLGELMGIVPELIPTNIREAVWLDKQIATRQFRSSACGKELTNALMTTFDELAGNPLLGELFRAQSRFLLGDTYADMLGMDATVIPQPLVRFYNQSNVVFKALFG